MSPKVQYFFLAHLTNFYGHFFTLSPEYSSVRIALIVAWGEWRCPSSSNKMFRHWYDLRIENSSPHVGSSSRSIVSVSGWGQGTWWNRGHPLQLYPDAMSVLLLHVSLSLFHISPLLCNLWQQKLGHEYEYGLYLICIAIISGDATSISSDKKFRLINVCIFSCLWGGFLTKSLNVLWFIVQNRIIVWPLRIY